MSINFLKMVVKWVTLCCIVGIVVQSGLQTETQSTIGHYNIIYCGQMDVLNLNAMICTIIFIVILLYTINDSERR